MILNVPKHKCKLFSDFSLSNGKLLPIKSLAKSMATRGKIIQTQI